MYTQLTGPLRDKIERQLIHGLFQQRDVILIGGITPTAVAIMVYVRSGRWLYLGWALAALMILAERLRVYSAFHSHSDETVPIQVWRDRFVFGTWLNAGVTGFAAAYAVVTGDGFTQMLVITQLTSFVMGSAARNHLYPPTAIGSILLAEIPLIVACCMTGDPYFIVSTAFVALFAFAALSVARHLYNQTVKALVTTAENEHAASRDKLTGLANRALFMARLESAVDRVESGRQRLFAVLFLDFDRFKLVNDTLGHEAGDELLRQIAGRLQGELRTSDLQLTNATGNVVGRFGGDEFLLLINDVNEPGHAVRIAERLLNALAPAYEIRGTEVHSSASIGIVTSDQCAGPAEDVVRNADVAMFEAKRAGRACSVVFNESMQKRLTRHVTIENGLRRAIGTAQMHLVYQPIVDLSTGRMVSAEALIRWNHPTLGSVPPAEFIPIAEDSALIIALGKWVQREACAALVEWLRSDPANAPATVSVNVSRAELALGLQLLDQIRNMLDSVGLPPQRLQVEVTEREVMRDPEGARVVLQELRRLGVRLAMDDFGTGTSSLSLLRDFPFDTIKIDRSFIEDIAGRPEVLAVIHATISLVENLGMVSVAEGVEDATQAAILQSMGCRMAQGYLYSRPVAAEVLLNSIPRQPQASLPQASLAQASNSTFVSSST